ncbi:outer membrane beta-barrel family protein [uncultured Chitinophaga sp.]|jgi:Outer membrane receptor proteins, mostly Fe transport|uniref:outer membrane beta-barrel family protein n=1 Tax=uncultured Chitinophaga sp. TaxID=339340 RepID=UPI00261F6097|nr:outer membrane beta-barrel family protein [uncultured Chitinophaga sp.]
MKNGLLTLLTGILSCPFFAYAQRSVNTGISGQVADSASRKPLAYATITLLKTTGLQPVINTLTDHQGYFLLKGIDQGEYRVSISNVGYASKVTDPLFADSLRLLQLPTIYLAPAARQLQTVNVNGQKPLLEVKDDKLIYNVENDISKDVLTAAEMLRKVPLVTVDPDGNIQLKGSDNFKILLNGKSTSMMSRNPKEALRAFPASLIKSIEVISQPSARYDAEGAAGIINIVTREKYTGYNGSLFANYNTRGFAGGGASFNAKAGKLGIAAYLGSNYFRNKGRLDGQRQSFVPHNQNTLLQNGTSVFDGTYYFGNLELSYDLDSSSSVSLYSNVDLSHNSNNSLQQNLFLDSLLKLSQTGQYDAYTKYRSNTYDVGLDYQKKFRQSGRSLAVSVNRNSGNNGQQTDNRQTNEPGQDQQIFNNNDEHHTETTFQADYTQPLPRKQSLETGAKAILRTIESDYQQQVSLEGIGIRTVKDRTDVFHYKQNVFAVYANYRFKVKQRLNVLLGARLEQTHINANFISSDTLLDTDYLNFMPSASVSLPLGQAHVIGLSYSRRLQRPWVWNLNPYVVDIDPNNLSFGNPGLRPEQNQSFQLGYNGRFKSARLTLSVDHVFTNNAIEPFTAIDDVTSVTVTTYANIGRRAATGFNLSGSLQPAPRWGVLVNARGMYTNLEGGNGTSFRNYGWSSTTYISTDYDLGKGFKTEATLSVNTSKPILQGRSPGYTNHTLTLRKELFQRRAVLAVHLDQPFQKEIAWRSELKDPLFYRASTFYYPVRALRVSLNWKFGQLKESVSRKKGVNNNDIKQNDGTKP